VGLALSGLLLIVLLNREEKVHGEHPTHPPACLGTWLEVAAV
jgi:hypothetical protein